MHLVAKSSNDYFDFLLLSSLSSCSRYHHHYHHHHHHHHPHHDHFNFVLCLTLHNAFCICFDQKIYVSHNLALMQYIVGVDIGRDDCLALSRSQCPKHAPQAPSVVKSKRME